MNIEIFNKSNIDSLDWPDDYDSVYAKKYFLPMMKDGTRKYISNVDAQIYIIKINGKIIPIVKAEPGKENCYVCSPYSQYIDYSIVELKTLNFFPLEVALKLLLKSMGVFFKWTNFNNVVYVNNWFLSTNLYLKLSQKEIACINELLEITFPGDIIIYRSLNSYTSEKLMIDLESLGGKQILSRQVYIMDPKKPDYKNRNDFKKDLKLFNKTTLKIRQSNFGQSDIESIKVCYDYLYIDKYTDLNPQFTHAYIENAISNDLLKVSVVEEGNKVYASSGYFYRDGVMASPLFGFDILAPQEMGLYRILSIHLFKEMEEKNFILNHSSGAAHFKRQRGASPYIEYNYYFDSKAPLLQMFSWTMLRILLNKIGIPILQKFKL